MGAGRCSLSFLLFLVLMFLKCLVILKVMFLFVFEKRHPLSVEAGSDNMSWEEEGPCVRLDRVRSGAGWRLSSRGLPIAPRVLAPWGLVVSR